MAAALPAEVRDLIDTPEFGVLSTINPDGSAHQCVMWVGHEDDEVVMATRRQRPQHRNLLRDPRASVLVYSRTRPTLYAAISGTATLTDEGAVELIDRLALAYTGRPHLAVDDDRARVAIRLAPERVHLYDASRA